MTDGECEQGAGHGNSCSSQEQEERLLTKMKLLITLGKEETRWLDPREAGLKVKRVDHPVSVLC